MSYSDFTLIWNVLFIMDVTYSKLLYKNIFITYHSGLQVPWEVYKLIVVHTCTLKIYTSISIIFDISIILWV